MSDRPEDTTAPRRPAGPAPDSEALRLAVLTERARRLAAPPVTAMDQAGDMQVLVFRVAGERYALESSAVRQVSPVSQLLPLPGAPEFLAGVVKMQGEVVSVTDLRPLFGLPPREASVRRFAVLLADREMAMAILAEEIVGVRGYSRQALSPPVPTLTGLKADLLLGITSDQTAILDARTLVTDKRLRAGESGDQTGPA